MSNIIPMVSSSPPPLDDGGGFNDWGEDDDDFGNFASATDGGNDFQAFTSAGHWNSLPDDNNKSSSQFANFADFNSVPDTSSCDDNKNKLNVDDKMQNKDTVEVTTNVQQEEVRGQGLELDLQKSHHIGVSDFTNNHNSHATNYEQDENLVVENSKQNESNLGKSCSENNFDSVSSISAGDSGLCSTDISPVPRSDEIYDPCDKSQGSDLDDFADFNSDSSSGKDVSIHHKESPEKVIPNNDMCNIQEKERKQMVATPTKFDSAVMGHGGSVSNDCTDDRQRDQYNAGIMETENDSVTPSEAISEVLSPDQGDSPTENVDIANDNISSQRSECCPEQLALSGMKQRLSDTHSVKENDCDISENCNIEQRLDDNDCNNADLDSCIGKNENSEIENLHSRSNESPAASFKVARDLDTVDQSSVVAHISNNEDLSCKLQHDVNEFNDMSKLDKEDSNETGHKSELPSIQSCYDGSDDDVAHPVAKLSDDCDYNKVQNVGSDSNERISVAFPSDEHADNNDFNDLSTCDANDAMVDNVQYNTSGDDQNNTFQNINDSEKEEEDMNFADFQETAVESHSDFEQHYSENADLELPSFKNFSTPTDNGSEDLELSKDSGKVDNSGDDSKTDDDLDDEFDDFADFQMHPSEVDAKFIDDPNSDGLGAYESENVVTSNCDFAAFQSTDTNSGDDSWAVFPSKTAVSGEQDDVDDDFGDFDEFGDFSSGTTEKLREKEGPSKTARMTEKRTSTTVIADCFPDFTKSASLNEDIPSVLEVPSMKAPGDRKSSKLWKNLQANDVSTKLARLWSDSRGSNKLFQSLRIDTRNILLGHRKPSVPVYASNLTLLEPTKGPVPSDSKVENRLVDTTKTEEKTSSQDLPPVQFDWTNSGLTNPLEANNKTLELDFLVVKETESVTKNGVFDSELMHGRDPAKGGMQPLQNILANLKSSTTMKRTKQTENLSKEANKVLNALPALSFMQAKVLMFPFRQDSDS